MYFSKEFECVILTTQTIKMNKKRENPNCNVLRTFLCFLTRKQKKSCFRVKKNSEIYIFQM